MDIKAMLAAALRNFTPAPAAGDPNAAKDVLGQGGVAAKVNPANREAYLSYVEREISEGRQPVPYPKWVGQAVPLTSQVED